MKIITFFTLLSIPCFGWTQPISSIPILEKVTGRTASFNKDVTQSCKVSGHREISEQEIVDLVEQARNEKEGIVFVNIRPQVPSHEYVAKLYNSKAQLIAKVNLLKVHENGFGRTGEASKRLVEIIRGQCS